MISSILTSIELKHWLESILLDRFGHRLVLQVSGNKVKLLAEGEIGGIVFDKLEPGLTQFGARIPYCCWNAEAEGWICPIDTKTPAPGVQNLPFPLIERSGMDHVVHYDILGLTYWMLSRVEEIGRKDLDIHGRFTAAVSHASEKGYLHRPVVDEWLYLLRQVVEKQWPGIKLIDHAPKVIVSHDVDSVSKYAFNSWGGIVRKMLGHLVKRHDLVEFCRAPYIKICTNHRLNCNDPFNNFDWIMDISEKYNLRSTFYFMTGCSDVKKDADYEPEHLAIRNLMRHMHSRGHEIGLHPSYRSFTREDLLIKEFNRLKRILKDESINQNSYGARMHYLRWEHPTTLIALDKAGLEYDSTLGYADSPGFRCGTSHQYRAFDPVNQRRLAIKIRPLIVMECSLISEIYQGLGVSETAFDYMKLLKERCFRFGGNFTLLWHNSSLVDSQSRQLYERIVSV